MRVRGLPLAGPHADAVVEGFLTGRGLLGDCSERTRLFAAFLKVGRAGGRAGGRVGRSVGGWAVGRAGGRRLDGC
jgi:hypothetical protein